MADNSPATKPAIAAVNVSQSSIVAPKVEAAPPTPPAETKPDPAEQLNARAKEIDRAHARLVQERRKAAEERKQHQAELAELNEYKRAKADKNRNPDKYLKADYGDDYYDKLTRLKTEGVPPADLIASELDAKASDFEKKLEAQKAEFDKRLSDMQAQESARAKQKYLSDAVEHAKANADKYKLLNHFREYDSVPRHIEDHFRKTCKQDAEGNWQPGETLSPDAASEAVEKQLSEIAEKFRSYFESEKKPSTETRRTETTPRSEGNTPSGDWTPPKSEKERMARALAAGERFMAERTRS